MHSRRTVLSSFAVVAFPSRGASNFIRVPLGQGASIEMPKNWIVLSANRRVAIDTYVEAQGFRQTESTLSFAAKVFDDQDKTMALVNARFYPDNAATQEQAKQVTASDIETMDAGIRKAAEAPLKSMGLRMTRWYGSKMQVINGLHVYVHEPPRNSWRLFGLSQAATAAT